MRKMLTAVVFGAPLFATAQNVGIGTTAPNANGLLHLDFGASKTKGLLATGNATVLDGTEAVPDLGAGTRLMFYPGKVAFRAGYVSGTQWNNANVGSNSVALGTDVVASGIGSCALGANARATNFYSVAIGTNTEASGEASLATGKLNFAVGDYSTAMGFLNVASGNSSVALGQSNRATGSYCIAMGASSKATEISAIAIGTLVTASGPASTALGRESFAKGSASFTLGEGLVTKGYAATTVGRFNDSLLANDQFFGDNNPQAPTPLFVVGNGTDALSRSNAFVVRRDGNVAVGNFQPEHRLDVGGRIRIRGGGNAGNTAGLWLNNVDNSGITGFVGVYDNNTMGLFGNTGAGWALNLNTTNGSVGLGTTAPETRLHVADDGEAVRLQGNGNFLSFYNQSNTYVGYLWNRNNNSIDLGTAGGSNFPVTISPGVATAATFLPNGNVGIGTTAPAQKLSVVGNVTATGTITSSSDIRFKTAVRPLAPTLASVLSLRPITYRWKKDFAGYTDAEQLGFSAQEVEALFPQLVLTDGQGYKSVDYGRLTPVLVQAMQQQQQQLDALQAENADLKARLDRLEKIICKQ